MRDYNIDEFKSWIQKIEFLTVLLKRDNEYEDIISCLIDIRTEAAGNIFRMCNNNLVKLRIMCSDCGVKLSIYDMLEELLKELT